MSPDNNKRTKDILPIFVEEVGFFDKMRQGHIRSQARAKIILASTPSTINAEEVHLSFSQVMPHINFPVGLKAQGLVNAMCDTCAGVSMGRLQYHKSVYEHHPNIVYRFNYMKDIVNLEDFNIGGVAVDSFTSVVAVIIYKTPFVINGRPMNLIMGLSEDCAANTILGLTFLRSIKATMCLDGEGSVISALFGKTFPIDYHIPFRGGTAPSCGDGNQAAFHNIPSVDPTLVVELCDRLNIK